MSTLKLSRTADQIESLLGQTVRQMEQYTRNANYVEAENSRLTVEQLKRDFEARKVFEMQKRHQREMNQLQQANQQQLNNFQSFWFKKIENFNAQGKKLIEQMERKHAIEQDNAKKDLQAQLSFKVKQSSQCLNLRKMEEHMVRQKNYKEAHLVQQRIAEMQKNEKDKWLVNRNTKIQTALNTLRNKQETQMTALNKKIKTGLDEQNKDMKKQEERLNLKYANIERQLKMTQQKEVLAYKGMYTSKGGQGSPLLTKNKFYTSRD